MANLITSLSAGAIGVALGAFLAELRDQRKSRFERTLDLFDEYHSTEMSDIRIEVWSQRNKLLGGDGFLSLYESMSELKPKCDRQLFYKFLALISFFRRMYYLTKGGWFGRGRIDKKFCKKHFGVVFDEWHRVLFLPGFINIPKGHMFEVVWKEIIELANWIEYHKRNMAHENVPKQVISANTPTQDR